jgi:hypothetical protein
MLEAAGVAWASANGAVHLGLGSTDGSFRCVVRLTHDRQLDTHPLSFSRPVVCTKKQNLPSDSAIQQALDVTENTEKLTQAELSHTLTFTNIKIRPRLPLPDLRITNSLC